MTVKINGKNFGDLKQVQDARFDNHLTDRRQERKFLLAHENNSTQQRVSEKVKTNSP